MASGRLTRRQLVRWTAAAGAALAVPTALVEVARRGDRPGRRLRPRTPGPLPPDGRPTVAGLTLPPGTRRRPEELYPPDGPDPPVPPFAFWSTNRGDERNFELAMLLAMAFPRTGLWPCLWLDPDEPEGYCGLRPTIARIDARKARAILAAEWERERPRLSTVAPFGRRFPGLAPAAERRVEPFEPFEAIAAEQALESYPEAMRPRLMLVPCVEPMDAVAVTGLICGTEYGVVDPGHVSSVLRSWEERFATTLVGLAPRAVVLAVGAPPRTLRHALRIAAEHRAFARGWNSGEPGALVGHARELLGGRPPNTQMSRDIWAFGWND